MTVPKGHQGQSGKGPEACRKQAEIQDLSSEVTTQGSDLTRPAGVGGGTGRGSIMGSQSPAWTPAPVSFQAGNLGPSHRRSARPGPCL